MASTLIGTSSHYIVFETKLKQTFINVCSPEKRNNRGMLKFVCVCVRARAGVRSCFKGLPHVFMELEMSLNEHSGTLESPEDSWHCSHKCRVLRGDHTFGAGEVSQ